MYLQKSVVHFAGMQKNRDIFVKALVQCSFKSASFGGSWIKALIFCRHFSVDSPKAFLQKLSAIPSNVLLSCQDHPSNNVGNLFLGFVSYFITQMEIINKCTTLFSGFKFWLLTETYCCTSFMLPC